MTFFKPIMGNQLESFNGSVYVIMNESGRISLYDHIRHSYVHLTEKMKWIITNTSFITLIIGFYHY